MAADPSRERRHLAVELMATARLITDARIRTTILALGEKWLDLAEGGLGDQETRYRTEGLRALQMKIGEELRTDCDSPQELSQRLRAILMELNDHNDQPDAERGGAGEAAN